MINITKYNILKVIEMHGILSQKSFAIQSRTWFASNCQRRIELVVPLFYRTLVNVNALPSLVCVHEVTRVSSTNARGVASRARSTVEGVHVVQHLLHFRTLK